jgi:group II intron reverse transcriptase/maturase
MLARSNPEMAFTSLNHYIDFEWVRYAYDCTRKDGAVGVDGQSGEDYAVNLTQNLLGLVDRLKSGRYRALPVRRHFIAKADGSLRGLGIPAFEDKVAQRAIVMLLEPIDEHDFHDCSFGFRPGRSAHEALRSVWKGIMYRGGQWVLDVDVRKYFDSIDQAKLRELLARRVTDGVVRRLIDKWLKAGVLDNGQLSYPELGTPQGGVISPCLANVFLHYVMDEWFAAEVQPRLRGPSTLVRFADDFVVILAHKDDAERVLRVLGKRLGKYGLELHPDKTQMIDFRFKLQSGHDDHQEPLATTFNFLGFTHVWVTSEKGRAMVRQLTAKDRVARTLKAVSRVCRGMRTRPLRDQHQRLSRMLKGHYAYFGISGNFERLATLRNHVARIWRKWLSRRSNERSMPWVAFMRILNLFPLPQPRIVRRYAKP